MHEATESLPLEIARAPEYGGQPLKASGFDHIGPGAAPPRAGELAAFVEQHRTSEASGLAARPAGHVYFQPVTQLEISATQIRGRLAAGGSARYLMPLAAIDIIEREGLYRDHEER